MKEQPQHRDLEEAAWNVYDCAIASKDSEAAFRAMEFIYKIRRESPSVKGLTGDTSLDKARKSVNSKKK